MRKNDPRNLALAARLRKVTTLPIKAITALVYFTRSKSANLSMTSGRITEAKRTPLGI